MDEMTKLFDDSFPNHYSDYDGHLACKLHENTTRILLLGLRKSTDVNICTSSHCSNTRIERNQITYLLIKHLTLCIQSIALLHQRINLFTPFQDTLNGFMQHNLCLV